MSDTTTAAPCWANRCAITRPQPAPPDPKYVNPALGIQGSGWAWLVSAGGGGELRIVTTKDQDPVVGGLVPLIGVDMWEHAYYLQYLNGKAAYVDNIWKVVNWRVAESRFTGKAEDQYGELRALVETTACTVPSRSPFSISRRRCGRYPPR